MAELADAVAELADAVAEDAAATLESLACVSDVSAAVAEPAAARAEAAASAALVDPYSHAYYLTVKVNVGDKRGEKLLMKNFIHSSSCDVIFNDDNINRIFN